MGANWNSANQRYLMASLRAVQEELMAYQADRDNAANNHLPTQAPSGAQEELEKAALDLPAPSALDTLVNIFNLSAFERKLLLLCAGIELDAHFRSLIADLQGDPSRVHPTFSLALAAFPDAHWSAIAPGSPLRYWRLIKLNTNDALASSPLKIDEPILHYITGVNYLDERLEEILEPVYADDFLVPSHQQLANSIMQACSVKTNAELPVLNLSGSNNRDKLAIAAVACADMGLQLYTLSIFSIPGNAKETGELVRLLNREAALNACALFLDCTKLDVSDKLRVQVVTGFIEKVQGILILSTDQWKPDLKRRQTEFKVQKPALDEQLLLWQSSLGVEANVLNGQLDKVAAHFNLSAKTIESASREVFNSLQNNEQEINPASLANNIWKACCVHTRPKVDELAQHIEPAATWDNIVLPEAQKQVLKEIAIQVRHRNKVYHDWGFAGMGSRGLGISALFTGESGTGKTMASEVLANELQLDLYRIDLSQVVNKYIGETEKNLKQIFDAAEEGGAILLFDEADALFGKRSDVKDSHDRYSNIEVSYLLQRMEAYRGLAVLTTNMKSAIDKAFLRRIRFVVHFPYPDSELRAEIWKRIFSKSTPVKDLDVDRLSKLNVSGGNIRNIAINAAFIAADEGQPVQMSHISRAVRSEYTKIEKALSNTETGGW